MGLCTVSRVPLHLALHHLLHRMHCRFGFFFAATSKHRLCHSLGHKQSVCSSQSCGTPSHTAGLLWSVEFLMRVLQYSAVKIIIFVIQLTTKDIEKHELCTDPRHYSPMHYVMSTDGDPAMGWLSMYY